MTTIPKRIENPNGEKTVIQTCLSRSKQLIKLRQALVAVTSAKTEVAACLKTFPSENTLPNLVDEIQNTIYEYQRTIANLLQPILAVHGIAIDYKYWFSSKEMKDGYVLFHKGIIIPESGASHVLFLREMPDTFDGDVIEEGEVRKYSEVDHLIDPLIKAEMEQMKLKKSNNEG